MGAFWGKSPTQIKGTVFSPTTSLIGPPEFAVCALYFPDLITKAVMRLMEAPTNVLFIKMDYDDLQAASADLGWRCRLLRRRRRLL